MLSLRFIESGAPGAILGLSLLLAACASPSPTVAVDAGGDKPFDRGAETSPEVTSLYQQAIMAMVAGDADEAELRLEEFLLQYPGYPGTHVNLAIIYAERDDLAAAEARLEDALDIDPGHATALNMLGMVFRRQGRFNEAETAYRKAASVRPDYPLAHYNLGVLNDMYLRRLDTAVIHYQHYLAIVGEDEHVERWIVDLERRIVSRQQSANLTE